MAAQKKEEESKAEEGVRVLLEPHTRPDHFPVFEIIFERFCHHLSVALHTLTAVEIEVLFEGITTAHFGPYLESVKDPNLFGVFHAEEWDNDGLIVFKSQLMRPLVELMLGGQLIVDAKKKASSEDHFTQIERHLADRLLQNCLESLSFQISTITPARFTLSHTEMHTRGLAIVRDSSPCVVASFTMRVASLSSEFQIVFPYTTIQPVRHLLADAYLGEKMGNDSLWVEHIHQELPDTHFVLEAVLDDVWIPIRDVLKWKKGTSFYLTVSPDSHIQLKCLGTPLFTAKMGQKKGMLALSVEEAFLRTDSLHKIPQDFAQPSKIDPSPESSSPLEE